MSTISESVRLTIGGMTCVNCQNRIARALRKTPGVTRATVSYNEGVAEVQYDKAAVTLDDIMGAVRKAGYTASVGKTKQAGGYSRTAGLLMLIAALFILLQHFGLLNRLVPSQLAEGGMGYGMLFVIGLLTSVHCVAMCGGINLSQSLPKGTGASRSNHWTETFIPSAMYNMGRVVSYTVIGFILGLIGLIAGGGQGAGLPAAIQGILKLVAGIFMIIMGVNMLGIFPALRKFQPRMPAAFASLTASRSGRSSMPFIVGLLNGLMPCGPLQSMQIVALASGNPVGGALSMLVFSLGTTPLMLGLGGAISSLGKRFTHKVMTVGAVLVVVLGLAMLSQGGGLLNLRLPAFGLPSAINNNINNSANNSANTTTTDNGPLIVNGVQQVNSTLSPYGYPSITVKANLPVSWTINAPERAINGCNYALNIYEYNIMNYTLSPGDNLIEFTPTKTGTFTYTCWMGMQRGSITVVE